MSIKTWIIFEEQLGLVSTISCSVLPAGRQAGPRSQAESAQRALHVFVRDPKARHQRIEVGSNLLIASFQSLERIRYVYTNVESCTIDGVHGTMKCRKVKLKILLLVVAWKGLI